jgi:hypothetical protein
VRKKKRGEPKKTDREKKNSLGCPKRKKRKKKKKKEKNEIAKTSAATNSSALKRTTKYTTLS